MSIFWSLFVVGFSSSVVATTRDAPTATSFTLDVLNAIACSVGFFLVAAPSRTPVASDGPYSLAYVGKHELSCPLIAANVCSFYFDGPELVPFQERWAGVTMPRKSVGFGKLSPLSAAVGRPPMSLSYASFGPQRVFVCVSDVLLWSK